MARVAIYFIDEFYPPEMDLFHEADILVILQRSRSKNDIGFYHSYRMFVIKKDHREIELQVRLSFVDKNGNLETPAPKHMSKLKYLSANNMSYFSMLQSMENYRDIISFLGVSASQDVLGQMQDLVFLKKSGLNKKFFKNVSKISSFRQSLAYNPESYFAYMNAESILDGVDHEQVVMRERAYSLRYSAHSFGRLQDLKIDFEFNPKERIPRRICALIGENGTGKSQAIKNFIEGVLDGKGRVTSGDVAGSLLINGVIGVGLDVSHGGSFPKEKKNSRLRYKLVKLHKDFKKSRISEEIISLILSDKVVAGKARARIFTETLKTAIPIENIGFKLNTDYVGGSGGHDSYGSLSGLIAISSDPSISLENVIIADAEPVYLAGGNPYPLSSGQKAFLSYCVLLSRYIENGSVLLLDEPELHLHPALISKLMEMVDRLLGVTGSVAIIATHSAYLVRELPRQQVTVLAKTDDSYVEVRRPTINTLGSDVGWLSDFVFGDRGLGNIISSLELELKDETDLDVVKDDLSSQALIYLKSRIRV